MRTSSSNRSPPSSSSPFSPPMPLHGNERVHRPERAPRPARTPRRRPCGRGCRTARRASAPSIGARRLLEPRPVEPEQRHRRAVAREAQRDRAPDPGPGAGHDDVSSAIRSPPVRNLRDLRRRDPLAATGLDSVDCRCAEHGTRLGRSSPGGQYAEAEGHSGMWTKAHPARRIHGPVLSRAHSANASLCVCKEKPANCGISISQAA